MKLRLSFTSPYARKVRAAAIERGIADRIELVATIPWDPATDLGRDNPLGKVPTLILDDGTVLYDSPVICEYLDSLPGGEPLFPPAGPARWTALRRQALGDGMVDAAVAVFLERQKPSEQQAEAWIMRQLGKVQRALNALEGEAADIAGRVDIGTVAIAVALAYLDFRLRDTPWRGDHPTLAAWYDGFALRPSMQDTQPPAG